MEAFPVNNRAFLKVINKGGSALVSARVRVLSPESVDATYRVGGWPLPWQGIEGSQVPIEKHGEQVLGINAGLDSFGDHNWVNCTGYNLHGIVLGEWTPEASPEFDLAIMLSSDPESNLTKPLHYKLAFTNDREIVWGAMPKEKPRWLRWLYPSPVLDK